LQRIDLQTVAVRETQNFVAAADAEIGCMVESVGECWAHVIMNASRILRQNRLDGLAGRSRKAARAGDSGKSYRRRLRHIAHIVAEIECPGASKKALRCQEMLKYPGALARAGNRPHIAAGIAQRKRMDGAGICVGHFSGHDASLRVALSPAVNL